MELFKRIEHVALARITSYAVVTEEKTTILHTNDQDPTQIDVHHVAGRQIGRDYKRIDADEILPILQRIHVYTGHVIHTLITERP